MKPFFTMLFLMFMSFGLFAQHSLAQNYSSQKSYSHYNSHNKKPINFNGQWKGGFDEGANGIPGFNDDIKYVLELTTEGSSVTGYSYTYFQEGIKRYYTICRLTGTLNRETNELVVTEVERTKFNTPPGFINCFQTHRLHYEKDSGNVEVLRGTWIPAPNQGAGCGTGTTVLSREVVSNLPTALMPRKENPVVKASTPKPVHKNPVAAAPKKNSGVASQKPSHPVAKNVPHPKSEIQKTETIRSSVPTTPEIQNQNIVVAPAKGFQSRRKDIIKTIQIEQPTFHLDFYDNGEIDGDSITVFYNGKIVLSHQRLSDKPISLTLTLDKNTPENIVTMYADNLGTIPPNTALMVVTDGGKRYEVRIESDTEKSGSVVFEPSK